MNYTNTMPITRIMGQMSHQLRGGIIFIIFAAFVCF